MAGGRVGRTGATSEKGRNSQTDVIVETEGDTAGNCDWTECRVWTVTSVKQQQLGGAAGGMNERVSDAPR